MTFAVSKSCPTARSLPDKEARIKRRRERASEYAHLWRLGSIRDRKQLAAQLQRKPAAFIGAVILESALHFGSGQGIDIAEYLARERWNEGVRQNEGGAA